MKNKLFGAALAALVVFAGANEGIKYKAYQDSGGVWTICYGSTKDVKRGDTATPEQCKKLLVNELIEHSKPLLNVPYQLPDNVLIAYTDFCYNIGVGACSKSTGMKKLNAGDIKGACEQILRWRFVAGRDCFDDKNKRFCGGIKSRRYMEYNLCAGNISIEQAISQQ